MQEELFLMLGEFILDNYVVLDTETTGLDHNKDSLIEISGLKVNNGEITDSFDVLINPKCEIPKSIEKLTGITNKEVSNKPFIEDVINEYREFLGNYCLIGHNVNFDFRFINEALRRNNLDKLNNPYYDTLQIAKKLISKDKIENHKQPTVATYFGIPTENAHRAIVDCKMCDQIFRNLKNTYFNKKEELHKYAAAEFNKMFLNKLH